MEKKDCGTCLVKAELCGDSAGGSKNHTPFFLKMNSYFSLDDTMLFWIFFYFWDPGYYAYTSATNPSPRESKLFETERSLRVPGTLGPGIVTEKTCECN